jgi:hypothetical protein
MPTPALGPLTIDEQFDIARTRVPDFANVLEIEIVVNEAEIVDDSLGQHVVLSMQLIITNTLENTVTLLTPRQFGFGTYSGCDDDVVHKLFKDNGEPVDLLVQTVDCRLDTPTSEGDFEIMESGKSVSYEYHLAPVNMFLDDDDILDHMLPPGLYYISATYDNSWVGPATRTHSYGDLHTDMNAWVGEVSSDRVSFVVPPYELPTEPTTAIP